MIIYVENILEHVLIFHEFLPIPKKSLQETESKDDVEGEVSGSDD